MNVQNNTIIGITYHTPNVENREDRSVSDMPTTAEKVHNLQNVLQPTRGLCKYANGSFYLGELLQNAPHGNGRLFDSDGKLLYEGGMQQGKYHGMGREYLNGKLHRFGIYRHGQPDDDRFEYNEKGEIVSWGDFKDGQYADKQPSPARHPEDNSQSKKSNEGSNLRNTHCETLHFPDGRSYKGQVTNKMPNGFGSLYDKDGILIYEGYFKEGEYHGDGKLYCGGILSQEGCYKDGKLEGAGRQYGEFGQLSFEGAFQQGRFHGYGITYLSGKQLYSEGIYEEGQRHGFCKIYGLNQRLECTGLYSNGKRQGEWTYYLLEGKVVKIDAAEAAKKRFLY